MTYQKSDRPMHRFQFSLASLLLSVAAVAVVLALGFHAKSAISTLVLLALTLVFMAFITVTLFYGRDSYRPFCIGAAFPLALSFVYMADNVGLLLDDISDAIGRGRLLDVMDFVDPINANEVLGTSILAGIVLGYLCVGFRWLIARPSADK
jgi:hypothetical protein